MGFFQSERWFADQTGLIRAEFAFREEIAAPSRQAIAALGPKAIAAHVAPHRPSAEGLRPPAPRARVLPMGAGALEG